MGVLRRGRAGRRVASGCGVERNQEEDVRVQQERHAVVCKEKVELYQRGLAEEREGVEARPHVPERDEDVRDVVHATVVNVV